VRGMGRKRGTINWSSSDWLDTFVREFFFRGDARSVFAKLHEESARRVDEFVRNVEQPFGALSRNEMPGHVR
jgi:hypothetical protein